MGWVLNTTTRPLFFMESSSTRCIVCWLGRRAGLEGAKISPLLVFDPRTVRPVASRYTDILINVVYPNVRCC
jgi:hypothetical protein